MVSVIFSTKLLDDNISYDPNEILDVKWFTYEELLNMKNDLRSYNWIINSITALVESKLADIKVSQFLSYMMEKDFLIAWGSKSYRPN